MSQSHDTELIIRLARGVVEQVAPEEFLLFPAISADYTGEPEQLLQPQAIKAASLSFDVGGLESLLAPFIISIVHQALEQMDVDITSQDAEIFLRQRDKSASEHFPANRSADKPEFPQYALDEIKDQAMQTALAFRIPEAKAEQIAVVLVEQLATRQPE